MARSSGRPGATCYARVVPPVDGLRREEEVDVKSKADPGCRDSGGGIFESQLDGIEKAWASASELSLLF